MLLKIQLQPLIKNYNTKWIRKAKIEKYDNNRIIKVFTNNKFFKNKSLSLILNYKKTIAILLINDKKIDEFIVKTNGDNKIIYELELKHRFREIYPQLQS